MSLETLESVAKIIQSAAAVAAVIGGALWAYYRFVKSRTFQARLTVGVSGKYHKVEDRTFIVVNATVQNVGAGKAIIKQSGTAIRLLGHDSYDKLNGSAKLPEEAIGAYGVFEGHDNAEPLESFEDCKVIQVHTEPYVAISIELRVVGGSSVFRAKDVVFPSESTTEEDS
jgi:hypothetical protein